PCSRIPPADGFPQTLQVRHAERPIVQPVTRAAGFAPDHAAVVGAHRTRESDVSESGQDLEQIHAAAGRGMSGLVKPALTRDPDIAAVREVDAASQTTHHGPPPERCGSARQIDGGEGPVVVRERRGPVGQPHGEVGACPVEDRHKVVAQHGYAELAHTRDAGAVVVDEPIAPGASQLDVLVHRDALDDGQTKLSPPPTRSTTSTQWRRLCANEPVSASYSTALQPCRRGPRISRRVSATRLTPQRSASRFASSRAGSGVASEVSSASIPSMARTAV